MTQFEETFNGIEDRQRILTAILRQSNPHPGTTLIAYVDRERLAVEAIECIPTPEPVLYQTEEGPVFDERHVSRLRETLRDIAHRIAPDLYWTGDRWSSMTGELVTIVCRDGETSISEEETQFWWGWRYSNHHSSAFHDEIIALTPNGWVTIWDIAHTEPALPLSAHHGN